MALTLREISYPVGQLTCRAQPVRCNPIGVFMPLWVRMPRGAHAVASDHSHQSGICCEYFIAPYIIPSEWREYEAFM